ncbi:MAG TPA: signal peptidase I [Gaiellaceae bacterium]|nr:signal peptidase I [Gaiellaceae bacterium]
MAPRWRAGRTLVWLSIATVVAVVAVFAILWSTSLLVPVVGGAGASNAPTIPACSGRYLAEGFTYRFRDPHRGELVVIHARGQVGGVITPDAHARDLNLTKRVIGLPGDTVVAHDGRVLVNGRTADDIPTAAFPPTSLGPEQYYVLGDNRSESQDSRDFGPVSRSAIFGRVLLIYWPLGRFGTPGYDKTLVPPGQVAC